MWGDQGPATLNSQKLVIPAKVGGGGLCEFGMPLQ